jgi:hypothetical protein
MGSHAEVGAMIGGAGSPSSGSVLPPGFPDEEARCLQPEKRLLLAVLEAAVSDFQKYATALTARGRRIFADADAWFASTRCDGPLDFESICQALGFDSSFIRAGLRRWRVARRREPNPSRAVLHFPFRRVTRANHVSGAAS